ncbi:hypothetical protein GGI05_000615, partial [Coemansia sp. RSA 2603]
MCSALLTTGEGLCAELEAALEAHVYGIKQYTPPTISDHHGSVCAQATVQLLDDDGASALLIRLCPGSGYSVVGGDKPAQGESQGAGYESLTALLRDVSPAFSNAMHRSLSERLLLFSNDED